MSEHLSRDEMIQRLYGMDTGASHLEGCPECSARFQTLEVRRAQLASDEEIPAELLAAQRRAVYTRMGERPHSFHSWVPALATAALVALGIYVYQPVKHYPQKIVAAKIISAQQVDVGDAQLFSEAVTIEQTAEPLAVAPIHGLFEGNE
jgi:anti-sigma factor RsiW